MGQGYKKGDKISQEHFKDYYLRSFVIKDTVTDSTVKFNKPKSVSVSENLPYWRLLRVDRILNLVIIRRRFSFYREGFNGYGDSNIVKKLASVEFNEFKGMNTF